MKKIKLVVMLLSILILAACTAEAKPINEDVINKLDFNGDTDTVIIDTDRLVIATKNHKVEFVETTDNDFVIHENENNTNWIFEAFWDYTIFIPSGQVKEISRKYTEAYDRTLPIKPIESEG